MREIRVLYVIDDLKFRGGAESHVIELGKRLKGSKFKAVIFPLRCSMEMVRKVREQGVSVEECNIRRIYSIDGLRAAIRMGKLIRENDVRVIQTFHFDSDVMGTLVGKVMGVPVIISSRRDMGDWWKKRRHIVTYRVLRKLIDRVIVVSDAVGEAAVRDEKLHREKVVTIYNGVDVERFNGSFEEGRIRIKLGLPKGNRIVSMIGNLHEIKGHKYFIMAAAEILREVSEVNFVIVGEGGLMKELVRLRDDLGLKEKILFLGRREDVREVLTVTDVSVLCSLSEGFSNTVLECMSMGKAIVATDVGGNPEAIVNNVTGLLVPPADPYLLARAVLKLIRDPMLCHRLGLESRKRVVERFSTEIMMNNIEKLYVSLLEERIRKA